jgi:hypothetical protein
MYTEEQIQIMKFFALLFGKANGGYVELRPTNYAGSPDMEKRKWIPANEQKEFADTALELNDQYHVYFGVATRMEEGKEKGRGTSQYIRELTCLYAELDGDDYEGGMSKTSEKLACFRPISKRHKFRSGVPILLVT